MGELEELFAQPGHKNTPLDRSHPRATRPVSALAHVPFQSREIAHQLISLLHLACMSVSAAIAQKLRTEIAAVSWRDGADLLLCWAQLVGMSALGPLQIHQLTTHCMHLSDSNSNYWYLQWFLRRGAFTTATAPLLTHLQGW